MIRFGFLIKASHTLFSLGKKLLELHDKGVDDKVAKLIHEFVEGLKSLVDHHHDEMHTDEKSDKPPENESDDEEPESETVNFELGKDGDEGS
ncbi:MAG: hypothetical protein OXM61_16685 [Candidatus Poribacteria bacterium]|nr:hypothetical protein [Candidatus Poribacteria bacterium]